MTVNLQSHRSRLLIAAVLVAAVAGPLSILKADEPQTQPARRNAPPVEKPVPPPELRYLAWKEPEAKPEDEIAVAWKPDGELVREAADQQILRRIERIKMSRLGFYDAQVDKSVRFLHMWFSHPDFDGSSSVVIQFTDASGKELPGAQTNYISSTGIFESEFEVTYKSGWMLVTKSPGRVGDDIPKSVNLVVRYAVGPWKEIGVLNAEFEGPETLLDGSTVDSPKGIAEAKGDGTQGVTTRTTLRVTRNPNTAERAQYDVRAVTHDGRELDFRVKSSGHMVEVEEDYKANGPLEDYKFDAPLPDIQAFKFRTRLIREVTFKDVSLQPGTITRPTVMTTSAEPTTTTAPTTRPAARLTTRPAAQPASRPNAN